MRICDTTGPYVSMSPHEAQCGMNGRSKNIQKKNIHNIHNIQEEETVALEKKRRPVKRKKTCEEEGARCWRLLRGRRAGSPVGNIFCDKKEFCGWTGKWRKINEARKRGRKKKEKKKKRKEGKSSMQHPVKIGLISSHSIMLWSLPRSPCRSYHSQSKRIGTEYKS